MTSDTQNQIQAINNAAAYDLTGLPTDKQTALSTAISTYMASSDHVSDIETLISSINNVKNGISPNTNIRAFSAINQILLTAYTNLIGSAALTTSDKTIKEAINDVKSDVGTRPLYYFPFPGFWEAFGFFGEPGHYLLGNSAYTTVTAIGTTTLTGFATDAATYDQNASLHLISFSSAFGSDSIDLVVDNSANNNATFTGVIGNNYLTTNAKNLSGAVNELNANIFDLNVTNDATSAFYAGDPATVTAGLETLGLAVGGTPIVAQSATGAIGGGTLSYNMARDGNGYDVTFATIKHALLSVLNANAYYNSHTHTDFTDLARAIVNAIGAAAPTATLDHLAADLLAAYPHYGSDTALQAALYTSIDGVSAPDAAGLAVAITAITDFGGTPSATSVNLSNDIGNAITAHPVSLTSIVGPYDISAIADTVTGALLVHEAALGSHSATGFLATTAKAAIDLLDGALGSHSSTDFLGSTTAYGAIGSTPISNVASSLAAAVGNTAISASITKDGAPGTTTYVTGSTSNPGLSGIVGSTVLGQDIAKNGVANTFTTITGGTTTTLSAAMGNTVLGQDIAKNGVANTFTTITGGTTTTLSEIMGNTVLGQDITKNNVGGTFTTITGASTATLSAAMGNVPLGHDVSNTYTTITRIAAGSESVTHVLGTTPIPLGFGTDAITTHRSVSKALEDTYSALGALTFGSGGSSLNALLGTASLGTPSSFYYCTGGGLAYDRSTGGVSDTGISSHNLVITSTNDISGMLSSHAACAAWITPLNAITPTGSTGVAALDNILANVWFGDTDNTGTCQIYYTPGEAYQACIDAIS